MEYPKEHLAIKPEMISLLHAEAEKMRRESGFYEILEQMLSKEKMTKTMMLPSPFSDSKENSLFPNSLKYGSVVRRPHHRVTNVSLDPETPAMFEYRNLWADYVKRLDDGQLKHHRGVYTHLSDKDIEQLFLDLPYPEYVKRYQPMVPVGYDPFG